MLSRSEIAAVRLSALVTIAAALLAGSTAASAQSAVWTIDPGHSAAQFSVRHMVVSNVRGEFDGPTGTVAFDPGGPAQLEGRRLVRHQERQHAERRPRQGPAQRPVLRRRQVSEDDLQVASVPSRARPGHLKLTGDLTIKGVTKEVILDVEGPTPEIKDIWGERRIGATATTTIDWRAVRAGLQPDARGRRRGRRRRGHGHDRYRDDSQGRLAAGPRAHRRRV